MTAIDLTRRDALAATAGLTATGLAGCAQGDSSSTAVGYLSTGVSDQPGDIDEFESCVVTIEGIWLGPQSADAAENDTDSTTNDTEADDAEREYYAFEEPQTADLVDLQGDARTFIDEDRAVPVGEYAFLQLDVTGVEGTLTDGTTATVRTPGEAPITFNRGFEIRANTRTQFVADFTPVRTGPPGSTQYLIQPVPAEIEVSYESVETEADNETNASASNTTA